MVTPADLTAPTGLLNPEWFTDLEAQLTAYLAHPDVAGQPDDVVRAYAYWRAFDELATRMMMTPSMQRDRNKTAQWSAEQLAFWRSEAERWLCIYEGELHPVVPMAIGVAR